MSNAERIALTRTEEDGYDSFNENHWSKSYSTFVIRVNGKIKIYHPRKENQ